MTIKLEQKNIYLLKYKYHLLKKYLKIIYYN